MWMCKYFLFITKNAIDYHTPMRQLLLYICYPYFNSFYVVYTVGDKVIKLRHQFISITIDQTYIT